MSSAKELIAEFAKEPKVAYKAYKQLETMVAKAGAPGSEEQRAALAEELAEELVAKTKAEKDKPAGPTYPASIRNKIVQLLSWVSTAKEVPALVEAMQDLDVRDSARMALERNTSDAAVEALIRALDEVGPMFLLGVVHSLGRKRRSATAQAALQKVAKECEDQQVRLAATEALAGFADPANDAIIAEACKCSCSAARNRAYKARIHLAEHLLRAGNKTSAMKIFQAIAASGAEEPQKRASQSALSAK